MFTLHFRLVSPIHYCLRNSGELHFGNQDHFSTGQVENRLSLFSVKFTFERFPVIPGMCRCWVSELTSMQRNSDAVWSFHLKTHFGVIYFSLHAFRPDARMKNVHSFSPVFSTLQGTCSYLGDEEKPCFYYCSFVPYQV